jgi:hypothetical protein
VKGALNSISGKTIDLLRNLGVGAARKIQFHDVAGGDARTIQIGVPPVDPDAPLDPRSAVSLTFGHVAGLDLFCYVPIKSLTVTDWALADCYGGRVEAPSIGKLTTRGQRANARRGLPAIAGDYLGGLHLWDSDAPRSTLGSVRIVGNLGSETQPVSWYIEGDAGRLDVKGSAQRCHVMVTGSTSTVKLGAALHSDFYSGVETFERHAYVPGDFTNPSASIGSIKIAGLKQPAGAAMPRCFVDSNFSAANVGSVQLLNVEGDNWGTPFGVWALEDVGSVRIRETEPGWVGAPTPDLHMGVVA